ncbi:MAG: dihydrofolate reductase family protein [Acidimicrobiales bacterium]
MTIFTRMCTSLDGYVTTPDGWPVQLAFDGWDAGALGFYDLQARCDSVLMGRVTFEPALNAPHWPWGDRPVFVLGGHRPGGTPEHVVFEAEPARLLERLREAQTDSSSGDVHLVGGPRTIETMRTLGALDEIRLMVLPIFTGNGRRLTPGFDSSTQLELRAVRQWPAGVVELVYGIRTTNGNSE